MPDNSIKTHKAQLFDGVGQAELLEDQLRSQVKQRRSQDKLKIAAIFFQEDEASWLYTELKSQAAHRVGIEYNSYSFSLKDNDERVKNKIEKLNQDSATTGIIIQKPTRRVWAKFSDEKGKQAFQAWWRSLTSALVLSKDVDGLHPTTLKAVEKGEWQQQKLVLPATCQAVLFILNYQKLKQPLSNQRVAIVGDSDLLGRPLFFELKNQGVETVLLDRVGFERQTQSGQHLLDFDIIVSATGRPGLIQGDLVKDGAVVIDAGEPRPDVDQLSVRQKAAFLTPVPGGVGPLTVVFLLSNCLKLVDYDTMLTSGNK